LQILSLNTLLNIYSGIKKFYFHNLCYKYGEINIGVTMSKTQEFLPERIFIELAKEYKKLPPTERSGFLQKLKDQFAASVDEIGRHITEVEYGEHIEGLYFNDRESLRHDRPYGLPYKG